MVGAIFHARFPVSKRLPSQRLPLPGRHIPILPLSAIDMAFLLSLSASDKTLAHRPMTHKWQAIDLVPSLDLPVSLDGWLRKRYRILRRIVTQLKQNELLAKNKIK